MNKRLILISYYFVFIPIIFLSSSALAKEIFSDIAYSIDPKKYNIDIWEDPLVGPYCYSILRDSIAFSNNNEIIIIDNKGAVTRRINFNQRVSSFDLNDYGNGFVSDVHERIYPIKNYQVLKNPIDLKGSGSSIQIDVIGKSARFISIYPAFIAFAELEEPYKTTVKYFKEGESIVIENQGTFIGEYKNKFIFLDWDIATENDCFHFITYAIDDNKNEICKKFDFVASNYNFGSFFQESYIYKLDPQKDCFYVMTYKDRKINIIRFDIKKLMDYSKEIPCNKISEIVK